MCTLLLDRSRHQGPEEVQLSVTETNAAGTMGMTFSPERSAHHCESHPLRDPTGARLSSEAARAWKSIPNGKAVPPNRKVLPLTKSQPLLITKGDLSKGEVPLVTKALFTVPFFFSFYFSFFQKTQRGGPKQNHRTTFFILIKSANRWRNRRRRESYR